MEDLQDLADFTYLELQEARGEMEDEEEELDKPGAGDDEMQGHLQSDSEEDL